MLTAAELALSDLLDVIDANVERRVLLAKRPNEPRTQSMLAIAEIVPQYSRARSALWARENETSRASR